MSLAYRGRAQGTRKVVSVVGLVGMLLGTAACSPSSSEPALDAAVHSACGAADCQGKVGEAGTDAAPKDAHVRAVAFDDASAGEPARHEASDAGLVAEDPSGDPVDSGSPTGPLVGKLRCDVAQVLSRCAECHAADPIHGAPMSLITLGDLTKPASSDASKRVIDVVLERVVSSDHPMPPAPRERLRDGEVATLKEWLLAGTPPGTGECAASDAGVAPTETADGGASYMPVQLPKPADCEQTFELKAHGANGADDPSKFTMAADPTLQGNEYHCFYFAPPFASGSSVLWYEPVLDNIKRVHHWILYTTDNATHAPGTHAACNATQGGSSYVALWAPGANNTSIPADVGLQLPTGPNAGLILELHYYNDSGAPQQDGSGIRFCTGKSSLRPHTATTHQLGTEGICLPPGASSVTGSCAPRTDLGESHIRGIWPHMHKRGRRLTVTVNRFGGASEVIHDEPFDFNSQVFYPKDIVIHPGDTVDTSCYYSNESTSKVHFGERTQDEMCYGFIMAWPPGSLASPPPLFGAPSGQQNRCVEGSSILRSCNGLADIPSTPAQP